MYCRFYCWFLQLRQLRQCETWVQRWCSICNQAERNTEPNSSYNGERDIELVLFYAVLASIFSTKSEVEHFSDIVYKIHPAGLCAVV